MAAEAAAGKWSGSMLRERDKIQSDAVSVRAIYLLSLILEPLSTQAENEKELALSQLDP